MRKIFILCSYVMLFTFFSCSSDDSGDSSTPVFGGGGGGGTGNVTIQVQGQTGQDGNYYFLINPSVAITLATVTITLTGTGNETIDINSQFPANTYTPCIYYPPSYAQKGSKWTFEFKGTLTNGGNAFDVTANYTIP